MPQWSLRSFALVAVNLLLFALMAVPVTAQCSIAPSHMTAWFPLDTMSSGVAENLSYGPDGAALNGPISGPGMVGNGWDFDGSNDYVHVPNHPSLNFGTGDFSISAWIKTSEAWGIIAAKREPVGNYVGYQFLVAHGQLLLQVADVWNGWRNYHSSSTPRVDNGVWHHVAATVDRDSTSGVRLYINGQLVHTFNATDRQGSISNGSDLSIGRANDAPFSPFDGVLDEVQLYNRALTASEVAGLHAPLGHGQCKPPFGLSASLLCSGNYTGSQKVVCRAVVSGGVPPYFYNWNYWGSAISWVDLGPRAEAEYTTWPFCPHGAWNSFEVLVSDSAGQIAPLLVSGPLPCY